MEQIVRAYLEAYSAEILDVRHLKREGNPVMTIDAKLPAGNVATFQLINQTLYRQIFNPKSKQFITYELVFQFAM